MAVEFDAFDWDDGNWVKCQKHGVSAPEIEQVLADVKWVVDDPSSAEKRYRTVGRTSAGRYVFVVFTLRGRRLRPISARFMHAKEVLAYEEALAGIEKRRGSGALRRRGGSH